MAEWTRCSDSQPEEEGEYLVTTKDRRVRSMTWILFRSGGCWYDSYQIRQLDVVAWMPLPEPYKEREE